MEMEFNKVIPENPEVIINMSEASEHVAEIKWHIRLSRKDVEHLVEHNTSKNGNIINLQPKRNNMPSEG